MPDPCPVPSWPPPAANGAGWPLPQWLDWSDQTPPLLLVVDDQPANVQALYQVFAPDHQVLMATRGEQALRLCLERRPDLVLLDVQMPGMDGYEVCTRLKADPLTADIPVIFVTGHDNDQAESKCLDVGAVDFIPKPFHPKIVRARAKAHIQLKRHADRLQALAFLDGLTGVYNRRGLDERLDSELRLAARHGRPLALLMIDVDQFKQFNDHHGHQAGDDCLRQLARAVRQAMRRPGDMVARYGGEEFVCILPQTDLPGATELARLVARSIHDLNMSHGASTVSDRITVSIGVAGLTRCVAATAAGFLAMADAQLYRAKAAGRNRICTAPAAPTDPDA